MCTYYYEPAVRYNEHRKYINYNRFITGVFLNVVSIYMWGAAVLLWKPAALL